MNLDEALMWIEFQHIEDFLKRWLVVDVRRERPA